MTTPTNAQRRLLAKLVLRHEQRSIGHSDAQDATWFQDGLLPVESVHPKTLAALQRNGWVEPYPSPYKPWFADAVNFRITTAGKEALT